MAFLHGVETVNITNGLRVINAVRTGVIGLVGVSPIGPKNEMKVITNPRQAVSAFGKQVPGFNIPTALDAIFKQGGGPVIVVNVFDQSTMTTQVTDESLTITAGKATLAEAPVDAVVLTSADGNTTYVNGTDYTVDEFGNLTVLNLATIAEASEPLATYKHLDGASVAASDIIGEVSGNTYSGFKMFTIAKATFGYGPKILISPTYSEVSGVATEMIAQAAGLEAITLIDAPSVDTSSDAPSDVVAERGVSGTYAGFQTSSSRVQLLWPYLKVFDTVSNAVVLRPSSAYWAGALSAQDEAEGYWISPSNIVLQGVEGVELNLRNAIDDTSSDLNLLNAAGISTFLSGFGTGVRTWGNRSAAYPSETSPINFLNIQRVQDILNESVRDAMLPFIDRPINNALIDSITETVNGFIRTLVQRGALIDGECIYDPDSNTEVTLAAGQLIFRISFMPPTPAERITFESFIDTNRLSVINDTIQTQQQ